MERDISLVVGRGDHLIEKAKQLRSDMSNDHDHQVSYNAKKTRKLLAHFKPIL